MSRTSDSRRGVVQSPVDQWSGSCARVLGMRLGLALRFKLRCFKKFSRIGSIFWMHDFVTRIKDSDFNDKVRMFLNFHVLFEQNLVAARYGFHLGRGCR